MEKELVEIIALLEQALIKIKDLRQLPEEKSHLDIRSLAIAVTNIETGQLWVANSDRSGDKV